MDKGFHWHYDPTKYSPVQYLAYVSKELAMLETIPITAIKQLSQSLQTVCKDVIEQSQYDIVLQSECALKEELDNTKTALHSASESIVMLLSQLANATREIGRLYSHIYLLRVNARSRRNRSRSPSASRTGR